MERIAEQYGVEKNCRNCEHAFLETCKGCNTLLPNKTYENFELRKELANGIGDMTAETAKWDMLCNRLGNIIANGDDCENNCCQGFLDMVNEIKHYDGEYERQLYQAEQRLGVNETK